MSIMNNQSVSKVTFVMNPTNDLNQTICNIRHAFQLSNWMQMAPATRNYILWTTQSMLELPYVDAATKDALREERQAAIALIRERIEKALDIA